MMHSDSKPEHDKLEKASDSEKSKSTRRAFLASLGVTTATAGALLSSPKETIKEMAEPPKRYGMVIDVDKCTGCHACTVACKSESMVPIGKNRAWVEYVEKGEYPNVSRSFLPRLCNQCSKPQCVTVCPTDATYQRSQDGIVVVDEGLCIGCKYCIHACPYDARFLNPETGFAEKCDFCIHRVTQGLDPACVNTCVGGAMVFGDLADPTSDVSKLVAENAVTVLRSEMGTYPNVYYINADLSDESDEIRVGESDINVITHRPDKRRR